MSDPINFAINTAEEVVWQVPLGSLMPWNPFKNTVWDECTRPLRRSEVTKEYKAGKNFPYEEDIPRRVDHARRIAYFIRHGWQDAIEVDVGVPDLGCHVDWIVTDGNHRLAAAFYLCQSLNDPVLVSVSGDLDYAEELLKPVRG